MDSNQSIKFKRIRHIYIILDKIYMASKSGIVLRKNRVLEIQEIQEIQEFRHLRLQIGLREIQEFRHLRLQIGLREIQEFRHLRLQIGLRLSIVAVQTN